MAESISGKIIKNTGYNVLGYFWGAVIALLLTPYTVSRLGDTAYGLLVIAGILTGYFGLLDFGINTAFIKYISGFKAAGRTDGVNRVIVTGLLFYLAFSAAVALPGLLFAAEFASLFRIGPDLRGDALFLIQTGFLIFAVTNLSSPFASAQRGLQRMDISNKLSMAAALLSAAGTVLAVETGAGVRGVMAAYLLTACARALADILVARRICPGLSLRLEFAERKLFRELFSFGVKLQVTRVSGMLSAHLDKLLIGGLLSAGLVTAYQVGNMVAVYAVSAFSLLTAALMPAFAEADSGGDRAKAVEGYEAGTAYIGLAASPLFFFLALCAPEIIRAWMGPGYENSALALRLLAGGWLVNTVLGSVGGAFVQALGRPQVQMRGALLNILLNPALSVLLLLKFGFAGAVAGTSLSVGLSALYFAWDLHREFQLPLRRLLVSSLLVPAAAAAAASAGAWAAFCWLPGFPGLSGRLSALAEVSLRLPVFAGIYLAFLLIYKPLRSADADRFFGPAGRLRELAARFSRPSPEGRPAC